MYTMKINTIFDFGVVRQFYGTKRYIFKNFSTLFPLQNFLQNQLNEEQNKIVNMFLPRKGKLPNQLKSKHFGCKMLKKRKMLGRVEKC